MLPDIYINTGPTDANLKVEEILLNVFRINWIIFCQTLTCAKCLYHFIKSSIWVFNKIAQKIASKGMQINEYTNEYVYFFILEFFYLYNTIFINTYIYVYIYIYIYIYIWYSFWAKVSYRFHIETWPEWDSNPRPRAYRAHVLTVSYIYIYI